jgi:REP element-mobilizing transposase RayT
VPAPNIEQRIPSTSRCARPFVPCSQHLFATLALAIRRASQVDPERFRVVHFSVQYDHIHLIVEARDKRALSRGMQGLAVRTARYVNDLLRRRGKLWADRWHGRALTSPRSVRNALVYVLMNFRKHGRRPLPPGVDAFSSAGDFDGWLTSTRPRRLGSHAAERPPPLSSEPAVVPARTWLARVGWRKHGPIGTTERPQHPS